MRKNRRFMKVAAMTMAGATMFQFGGCFGATQRNIPVGLGQGIGNSLALVINAALLAPVLGPVIEDIGDLLLPPADAG